MTILFIEYPKCSTCQKAKNWLMENHIDFIDRHVVEHNPSEKELKEWLKIAKQPLKSFFNTSGLVYKTMELKDKLPYLSEEEQIRLLSSNGMLVKRPLIIGNDFVLIGFKESVWKEKLL